MILETIRKIILFKPHTINIEETWTDFNISGKYYTDFYKDLENFKSSIEGCISIDLDNIKNIRDDLDDYISAKSPFKIWSIYINKSALNKDETIEINFFYKIENCIKFFDALDPYIINLKRNVIIYIPEIENKILGPSLSIISPENQESSIIKALERLPNNEYIKENVHFITSLNFTIDPLRFHITEFEELDPLACALLRKSCTILITTLVNEFYEVDKVKIDGIRKILLRIADGTEQITKEFYNKLIELVIWIYEDKITVRRKLFYERLTLEYQDKESLLSLLIRQLNPSLEQAKERYNFVIIDRKDAYLKELKDLLKDIKSLSESYAGKIRTIISNFLRDFLAALVLIGFTIFTKFNENFQLDKNNLLDIVFTGLGFYFLFSCIIQGVVDCVDIYISTKEMKYWKHVSKELIPETEFSAHVKKSLSSRKTSFYIFYPIIIVFYILISVCCFRYPKNFKELIINKNNQVTDQVNLKNLSPSPKDTSLMYRKNTLTK